MTHAASALDAVPCLRVSGAGAARGCLTMPGDKSISHRAVLMSAMARGSSVITGLSPWAAPHCPETPGHPSSHRSTDPLHKLTERLAPYEATPAVKEFRERARAVLTAA